MADLVPIKVTIRKGSNNGQRKLIYPNFNIIDESIRNGLKWSYYIDAYGTGWSYDKVENIGKGNETGACVTCVPKDFADAAISLFPLDVQILSESEMADFWDNRSHVYEPDEHVDIDALQAIKLKEDLGVATPEKANAINPLNETKGIRKNKNKKWVDFKADKKITLDVSVAP